MFSENLKNDIRWSIKNLEVDPEDAVSVSMYIALAVRSVHLLQQNTMEVNAESILDLWENHGLSDYAKLCRMTCDIPGKAQAFADFCMILIQRNLLSETTLPLLYRDFLQGAIGVSAIYRRLRSDDQERDSALIYLVLCTAKESLGSTDVFDVSIPHAYCMCRDALKHFKISSDEFNRWLQNILYIPVPQDSVAQSHTTVDEAKRAYEKMQVKKSMLLTHYVEIKNMDLGMPEMRRINPWADLQQKKGEAFERGVTEEERLFNYAAYRISKMAPTDVVQELFYKGRSDERIENTIFLERAVPDWPLEKSYLIINPSPTFLCAFNMKIQELHGKKLPSVTCVVPDDTVCQAYSIQFHKFSWRTAESFLTEEGDLYRRVILMARDFTDHLPLFKRAYEKCQAGGEVFVLAPETILSSKRGTLKEDLEKNQIYVDWIMKVPKTLTESKPREKVMLYGKKGDQFKNETIKIFEPVCDSENAWMNLGPCRCVIPAAALGWHKTLRQICDETQRVNGSQPMPQSRALEKYFFSREIILSYSCYGSRKGKLSIRATYKQLSSDDHRVYNRLGTGRAPETEKGLRGDTIEEILPKMEDVPFAEDFSDFIIADIRSAYGDRMHECSFKTIWYCCRPYLLRTRNYNEERIKAEFCGADPLLANLTPGDEDTQKFATMLDRIAEDHGFRKMDLDQLYLILQVAVAVGYLQRNPMQSCAAILEKRARSRLNEVSRGIGRHFFYEKEEAAMLDFLMEKIPVSKTQDFISRCIAESVYLVGLGKLVQNLELRELCVLTWGDFYVDPDTGEGVFLITHQYDQFGKIMPTLGYGNGLKYRKIPVSPLMTPLLMKRKAYLKDRYGLSDEQLKPEPIMLEREPAGKKYPKKTEPVSVQSARKILWKLLDHTGMEPEVIRVREGGEIHEINLNERNLRLFDQHFRMMVYRVCRFTEGEMSAWYGNQGPDVFSCHYCDFENPFVMQAIARKLNRWVYRYLPENQDGSRQHFRKQLKETESAEWTVSGYPDGLAAGSFRLTLTRDAKGEVEIMIDAEDGIIGQFFVEWRI